MDFADFAVQAVPYDLPIPGYGTAHISTLRLWESVPIEPFDFDAFNRQDYTAAVTRRTAAENLTRVLYPNDTKEDGKRLRLRQQYFYAVHPCKICCAGICARPAVRRRNWGLRWRSS